MSQHPPQWPAQPPPPYDAGPLAYSAIAVPRTSGLAIASMVVGIVAVVACMLPVLPGVVAVVLGLIALRQTAGGMMRGRGFAIAGIATGAASILLSLFISLGIWLPAMNQAREGARRTVCTSNMRQIGQALFGYASLNDGLFPPDLETLVGTDPAVVGALTCPSTDHERGSPGDRLRPGENLSFTYVGGGLRVRASADVVLLHESVDNHDRDGANFLFADGSVRFVPRTEARAMIQLLEQGINPPNGTATP